MSDTVSKINEETRFVTEDGSAFPTMDEACDYQEEWEFKQWCSKAFQEGEDDWRVIAQAILANFKVKPK